MACKLGKSVCETCEREFEWRRHDSQPDARFCGKKCTNRDFGIKGNEKRLFWPTATDEEKRARMIASFEEKVIRQKGCWRWKDSLDKNGYAYIYAGKNKHYKAHRLSYEMYKGDIPQGFLVCHSCDNPTCTNPEHLWLGSIKENSEDSVKKGRSCHGESRPLAKLKDSDIPEIRKMLSLGVTKAFLSRKYGVSFMAISLVGQGKTWKHVQ